MKVGDNMNIEIRKAKVEEAKDIVMINNIEWRSTYKGLIPNRIFDMMDQKTDQRIKRKQQTIKEKNNTFVALLDGKVVGFSSYGKAHDDEYSDAGQIYACYILDEYHKYGIGSKLIAQGMQALINDGYTTMISGCLVGNSANEFHKYVGGKYIKTIDFDAFGYIAKENIYYYEDINKALEMNKEKIKSRG